IAHLGQRGWRVHDTRAVRKAECRLAGPAWEFNLVEGRRTLGLATKATEAAGDIGLKSDARLFAVIAYVNAGFDLFGDDMRGCGFHFTGQLRGVDRFTGFLADQQLRQFCWPRQTADMTDQYTVGAH